MKIGVQGRSSKAPNWSEGLHSKAADACVFLLLLPLACSVTNTYPAALTNDVTILDKISFAVTDHAGTTNFVQDVDIISTNLIAFIISERGASNRTVRANLDRLEMPVLLELRDAVGKTVPRTRLGGSNALAPPKETKFNRSRFERLHFPGGLRMMEVGYLADYFEIKEAGSYTLEARLRYWAFTNKTFGWFLTPPVRLQVIVPDLKTESDSEIEAKISATNGADLFQRPKEQRSVRGRHSDLINMYSNSPFAEFLRQMTNRPRDDVRISIPLDTATNSLVARLIPGGPPPLSMAVTIDQPRPPESAWVPFQTNYLVSLPPKDGRYSVAFSFRFPDRPSYTAIRRVTLDTTPPFMTFTNPANGLIPRCRVRLQGAFSERVYKVRRYLRSGFTERELVECSSPSPRFDPILKTERRTFDCDLDLSPGPNEVIFKCEDAAGNKLATNFTLIVNRDNRPPGLALTEPIPSAAVNAEHITISGQTDDAATEIRARHLGASVSGQSYGADVWPDGKFLIRQFPVVRGSNLIQLLLTDCAGFNTVTNISVFRRE